VVVQQPAPEPPPAPPSDAALNQAITDFAAGRITGSDLESVLAGEPIALAAGDAQQPPGTPPNTPPVVPEVTRLTIEAANAALAQIRGGPKTAPYQGTLRYVGTDWNALFQRAASNSEMNALVQDLVGAMSHPDFADLSSLQRAFTLSALSPKFLDGQTASVRSDRKELFALSMSDAAQTSWLRRNGFLMAVAAKRTNNPEHVSRVLKLLEILNSYQPLQRNGRSAHDLSVPIDPRGEGVWLATAWGISAIVDILTALGDAVPPDLRTRLTDQIRTEIRRICEDWRDQVPWFARTRYVQSNQWMEVSAGLIKGCLFLGDPELLPAYNLGVDNILCSLAAHGSNGEYLEGLNYAQAILGPVLEVTEQMRLSGDARAAGSTFASNNWKWFAHMHLPAMHSVNCGDARDSMLPSYCKNVPYSSFSAAARAVGSPSASTMRFLYPNPTPIGALEALLYADFLSVNAGSSQVSIDTFAYFPGQELVVWRNRFEPIANGQTAFTLWVKGGTIREDHVRREQGHVSIGVGARTVISNCGTSDYLDPLYVSNYGGSAGSNIMQIGQLEVTHKTINAPVTVNTLGPAGGEVDMNTSAAYINTTCTRNVSWDSAGNVRIIDNVSLPSAAASGTEIYRFHTGSAAPLNISGSDKEWDVTWTGTTLHLSADSPIVVDQVTSPNKIKAPFQHQTIRIKTKDGTARLQLVSDFVIDLSVTQ
jgi:hypothetical protein